MELTAVTRMGDKELRVKGVTLKEMLGITGWTGYENKKEWLLALDAEKPLALQAAYALAIWRESGTKPRIEELDFDIDTLDTFFIDETDQRIEIVFELNADGISLKKDETGAAIPASDKQGRLQFRYSDTGELVVRPTEAPPARATSRTPRSSGRRSASPLPTPPSETA